MINLMIPIILFLGIITSYTDIKNNKVKNKHLLIVILLFLIVNIIYFNLGILSIEYIQLISNFIIAFIVGYLLWHVAIWTSGDAKLFIVYSLLLPFSIYQNSYVPFFPSIVILINTFVPFFIFYFLNVLIFASKKDKLLALKNSLNIKKIMMLVVALFSLLWLINLLSGVLGRINPLYSLLLSNYFIVILVIFILMEILQRTLSMNFIKLAIVISVLRLFFDKTIYSLDFVKMFVLMILIFIFARFFILQLTHKIYVKYIDIHLLRAGMIPAERVFIRKKKYYKEPLLFYSLFSYLKQPIRDDVFDVSSEGLTSRDCRKLRMLKREEKIKFDHLKVYQTLPFAVFLFVGVLITILVNGNLFIFIANLF
jgi:Flp pilus assembly protein protease CpaA